MKITRFLYIVLLVLAILGCDVDKDATSDTEDPPSTEPIVYEARILTFSIVKDGIEYPIEEGAGDIIGFMPYKTDMSQLVAKFTLSEGATVYVNDVEQVSGVTVNDFRTYKLYKVISKDGQKQNIFTVDIRAAKNTEAKLYSMSVLVDSTEYPCIIENGTITVDFPDKYWGDLFDVYLKFVISEDAKLEKDGFPKTSEITPTNLTDYQNVTIKVIAQNTAYYTTYDMIITCLNCSK